jgi:Redoxin
MAALIPPGRPAPDWRIAEWIGAGAPADLAALRGKVIVLHAFQLLCPACVHHGIPQAQRIQASFPQGDVSVIGLHTVFEHHEAMTPTVLRAFMHEYRIGFPVGVDAPSRTPGDPSPETMRAYGMRGTPTLILIDRHGNLRHHGFGVEEDLAVGAAIATLVA